jgi:hypothetical protein
MEPKRSSRRTPLPTLVLHWGLVLTLAVSLATGLRIAADALDAPVSQSLAPWLPQGDLFLWHLAAGATVLGLVLAYALYQVRSGLWRRFLPRHRAPRGRPGRWERVNLLLHWGAFALLGVGVGTGLMQYFDLLPVGRAWIEAVHLGAAWGLVAYLLLHVAAQLAAGGPSRLLGMLLPRTRFGSIGLLSAVVAGGLVLGLVAADRLALATLTVAWTERAPVLDGRFDDPAWDEARPVQLRLGNGANLPGGETSVQVRALHDGERVYFLVEWTDPTRSQKHVPLHKTPEGWRILQTAYRKADENRYYEDKLALMLSPGDPLAALASIHLGERPLDGQPGAPGGRGLHYTSDGAILDVWHWKSVRNGAQHQADDNFFGPPLPAPAETPRRRDPDSGAWFPRYTGGYRKDPPGTFSGFEMNWEYFSEDLTQPLRLPEDQRDLAQLDPVDLSPEVSDAGRWWIELNDTRPYADGPDDLPAGSVLPNVLPTGRLTGDRGDIRARGSWIDGRWHLELSRRLDTGSKRDVAIADGTLVWVAVFDHTQTRHAYHLRPLRLHLAPNPG